MERLRRELEQLHARLMRIDSSTRLWLRFNGQYRPLMHRYLEALHDLDSETR